MSNHGEIGDRGRGRKGVRARLAIATAAAVAILYGVQGLTAALPSVQSEFGVSDTALGLFTAAYMLPAVVFAIPLGWLADTLGRRRVFVVAAVLFSVAGGAQAWAPDFETLLALRFVQGVGFGALMPLTVTLIGDALRGAKQLQAQASRQVAMTLGEFAMPLIGAALLAISWRAPLAAQFALLLLAVGGALVLDDEHQPGGASRAYARELTGAVRGPGMGGVLVAGFLRFWCKFALLTYAPTLLIQERGASPLEAALVVSVASLVAAVSGTQSVRVLRHVAASRLLATAIVLSGAGLIAIAIAPTWPLALVASVVFGVGDGWLMVMQNSIVTEAAPPAVRAGLVGVNSMVRNAGKLAAPLAIGAFVLVAPLSLALVAVAGTAWALVPVVARARAFDDALGGHVRDE